MPLQDLTPQLRTRLSRVEHAVGWFVLLAAVLLATGFVYYIRHTAQRKGWFQEKVVFKTCVNTAVGIKPGDAVKLMGFPVGEVLNVVPNEPYATYGNVTVYFVVRRDANNYCGYIWSDSKVRIAAADFLGNRNLELVKGQTGLPLFLENGKAGSPGKLKWRLNDQEVKRVTEMIARVMTEEQNWTNALEMEITNVVHSLQESASLTAAVSDSFEAEVSRVLLKLYDNGKQRFYKPYAKTDEIFIVQDESPALTERLEHVINQAEKALPNILNLTNQIAHVLANAIRLTSNLDSIVVEARPAVANAGTAVADISQTIQQFQPAISNITLITAQLREPKGSLGEWLIPTNINTELETALKKANETLASANTTITNADQNLNAVMESLGQSLDNLGGITSNLNRQVEVNTNILSEISSLIRDTDIMVQGLRRHWFLRSAFKTNAPPKTPLKPGKITKAGK